MIVIPFLALLGSLSIQVNAPQYDYNNMIRIRSSNQSVNTANYIEYKFYDTTQQLDDLATLNSTAGDRYLYKIGANEEIGNESDFINDLFNVRFDYLDDIGANRITIDCYYKINYDIKFLVYFSEVNEKYYSPQYSYYLPNDDNTISYELTLNSDDYGGYIPKISIMLTPISNDLVNMIENRDNELGEEWESGYGSGYDVGFQDAKTIYENMDETMTSIFVGILDIALVPVNFFLGILNFEVFGINIGAFVSGLLSIAVVVIIIRSFIGGNKSD